MSVRYSDGNESHTSLTVVMPTDTILVPDSRSRRLRAIKSLFRDRNMFFLHIVFVATLLGSSFGEEGHDELQINNQNEKIGAPLDGHPDDDLIKAETQDSIEHQVYPQHQGYDAVQGNGLPLNIHNYMQGAPSKHEGMGIPIPVPLPMPGRPGQIMIPNGPPQKGPHGPPGFGGPPGAPQPVYPGGVQQKHGGFPPGPENNYVEYGPEVQPPQQFQGSSSPQGNDPWPLPMPEMPKIVHLDVKCEKNLMKVAIEFDKQFNGIIFSKGHFSYGNCVHLPAGSGRNSVFFDVSINSCGTTGNTQNGLYGYGSQSGSGTFFENTIVIQYDAQVQEVWDQARKLRCTWHDQYEKAVTFRPFPVDMLDVVRADFAGDNVGCWMQIQVGKGPWASEVAGIVKIGQTMTMVLAIKDDENKFDMLVRNCIAHDGKRAPIELVDSMGCIVRPKLMSRFTKIKNFGSSASVLSYTHFQAFKFPDSMEVHFQCTIQICRFQCPEQCTQHQGPPVDIVNLYSGSGQNNFHSIGKPREERDVERQIIASSTYKHDSTQVGLNRIIQVVSAGDLSFSLQNESLPLLSEVRDENDIICMSLIGFTASLVFLIVILLISCLFSVFLCLRQRSIESKSKPQPNLSFTYDMRTYPKPGSHSSAVQMTKR